MLAAHLPFALGTIVPRTIIPWCIGELPAHSWPPQASLGHGTHTQVMAEMDQDLGPHPPSLEHPNKSHT